MKIWEPFCLQAGSHNVNTSSEMASSLCWKLYKYETKSWLSGDLKLKWKRGVGSLCSSVCTPGDSVSFERQIHSLVFVSDHFGYKGMKEGGNVYRDVLSGQMLHGWYQKFLIWGCEVKELTWNEGQQCVFNYYLQCVIASSTDKIGQIEAIVTSSPATMLLSGFT